MTTVAARALPSHSAFQVVDDLVKRHYSSKFDSRLHHQAAPRRDAVSNVCLALDFIRVDSDHDGADRTSSSVPEAGGEPSRSSRPVTCLPFLSVTQMRYIMAPLHHYIIMPLLPARFLKIHKWGRKDAWVDGPRVGMTHTRSKAAAKAAAS